LAERIVSFSVVNSQEHDLGHWASGAIKAFALTFRKKPRALEVTVAEIKVELPFTVQIPSNLGLSEAQQKQLQERFRNQLIEILSGGKADVIPAAKVEVVARVKNEVV
jgi:hypothetical protein